jgi:hypothetical protein
MTRLSMLIYNIKLTPVYFFNIWGSEEIQLSEDKAHLAIFYGCCVGLQNSKSSSSSLSQSHH